MKVTRTVTIDGSNKAEYEFIKTHLEELRDQFPGWTIHYEPLVNRATAVQVQEVDSL